MARVLRRLPAPIVLILALLPGLARAHHPPSLEPSSRPGGRIGVEVLPMTPELREYFGVNRSSGVLVARVEPESPAAQAEIRPGDVILEAGGQRIEAPRELLAVVYGAPEGARIGLVLSRGGERRELEVEPRPLPSPPHFEALRPWMGGAFRELREQMRELERRMRELEERLDPEGSGATDRT